MPPPFLREYWLPFTLNAAQIDTLLDALKQRGLPLPDPVRALSGGNAGISIIGADTVFKLIWKPPSRSYGDREAYIRRGLRAYENLAAVAEELLKRGVDVPRLLAGDILSPPVVIGGQEFLGWQSMTRVAGHPVPRMHKSYRLGTPKRLSATMLPDLTRLAARIHLPVTPPPDLPPLSRSLIAYFDRMPRSGLGQRMIAQFRRDVDRLTAGARAYTLLHGDYHALNLLRDGDGVRGVIDWDHLDYGWPELDLAFMDLMPRSIGVLCALYNSCADHPVRQAVVTAIAFARMTRRYLDTPPERPWRSMRLKQAQEFRHTGQRLLELGEAMRQATGKPVYSQFVQALTARPAPR